MTKNLLQRERERLMAEVGEKEGKGIQDPQAYVDQYTGVEKGKAKELESPVNEELAASMREHLEQVENQRQKEREARRAKRVEDRHSNGEGSAVSSHGHGMLDGAKTDKAS